MSRSLATPVSLWVVLSLSLFVATGTGSLRAATDSPPATITRAAPSHPGDSDHRPFRPRQSELAFKGTAVRNIDTGEDFPSIQSAIDDPDTAAGHTLEVLAALHDEGQVLIDKSITLRGASGTEVVRMAVNTGSVGDDRAWFLVEPSVDLHVRDLTFDGNGFLVYQAFRHRGTGSFEDCHFRDIQFNASGPDFRGTAIVAFGGNVDVRNCLFEQIGRQGIFHFGSGVFGASIENNVYVGKGDGNFLDYGIEVGGGAVVTLSNNVLTDCRGIVLADGSTSAGVLITTFSGPGTAMTATQNTMLDNAFGILVGLPGDTSVVNASFNRIAGNTEGLRSESPSITVENNWWGCNAGPNAVDCDSVTGTVDFDPWLVLGLSANPTAIAVGGTSLLTADLTENSDAVNTFGMGNVPDGIDVTFDGTLGTVAPPVVATTGGMASSDFTAGVAPGMGSASATVDNQTVVVDIEIGPINQPTLFIDPNIPARPNSTVDVPVQFNSGGEDIAAIIFSIDFDEVCLGFDPIDGDLDGIPDAITFNLAGEPSPPTLGVTFDAADADGELDFVIADFTLPFTPIPDGTLVTVTFDTLCTPDPGMNLIAPVLFSDDPQASFGGTSGQSIAGTTSDGSVEIFGTLAGDCNGDGVVDAGDLTACTLEVFDGDGNFWLDTPGGTFPGNPAGCDANADTIVDAGDLSCKVLIIFGGPRACMGGANAQHMLLDLPSLGIPAVPAVDITVTLPVFFDAAGQDINSLTFALEYDTEHLRFDPTDADGDGIPDAITLNAGLQTAALIASGDTAGEINLGLLNLFDLIAAPEGEPIATITLEIKGDAPPAEIDIRFSGDPEASFGSQEGQSLAGETEDGSVLTGALFVDGFESGDLSRWSSAVF